MRAALLAAVCLALATSGCSGSDSEPSATATETATGAESREFEGVLPEPDFATPGKAAYCSHRATSQEESGPTLFCWTPSDGWGVVIAWNTAQATQDTYDEPPEIVHGVGVLKGHRPAADPLPFGRRWVYRCTSRDDVATCRPHGDGRTAFTCMSRRIGLTCTNAVGHGFFVGRTGDTRLF